MPKDGEGENSVDQERISGIFSNGTDGEINPEEGADEEKSAIRVNYSDEYLYLQRYYKKRAEIRNDCRSWAERSPFLGRIFKTDQINTKTALEIAAEQHAFRERILKVLAREEKDIHPEKTLAFAAKNPLEDNADTMKREEFAMYTGEKMRRMILQNNYPKAQLYYHKTLRGLKDEQAAEALRTVGKFVAIDGVRFSLEDDPGNIAKALIHLGTITDLRKADFADFPPELLNNPKISSAIIRSIAAYLVIHPLDYAGFRDYFAKLGFLDAQKANHSKPVLAAAKVLLGNGMACGMSIFEKLREHVAGMGIMTEQEANVLPGVREAAKNMLIENIKKSPDLYVKIRDQLEELGIINADGADQDLDIQKCLLGHLLCWKDVHPSLYAKFRYHWALKGLVEPDPKELGINTNDAHMQIFEAGGTFKEISMEGYSDDRIATEIVESYECELDHVRQMLSTMPYLEQENVRNFERRAVETYHEFVKVFPQLDKYPDIFGKLAGEGDPEKVGA
jgi:hypothetical protein